MSGVKFTYREGQRQFSLKILEAIRDKRILFVEAGVGIGKSFGYLVPIFLSCQATHRKNFHILLVTSSIALEEQLKVDVQRISELLNIPVEINLLKGMNNYACMLRLVKLLEKSKPQDATVIRTIKKEITGLGMCDRTSLPPISQGIWDRIKIIGTCNCPSCEFRSRCSYLNSAITTGKYPKVTIANYAYLAANLPIDSKSFAADVVVLDEAHNAIEAMRLPYEGSIDSESFSRVLRSLQKKLEKSNQYGTIGVLRLFDSISKKASQYFLELLKALSIYARANYDASKNEHMLISDLDRVPVNLDAPSIQSCLRTLLASLEPLDGFFNLIENVGRFQRDVDTLRKYIDVFMEMANPKDRNKIFWLRFIDDKRVEIGYAPKSIEFITNKLLKNNVPVIITSATMTTGNLNPSIPIEKKYANIVSSFNPPDAQRISYGEPIASPYDYKKHGLIYCDRELPNPNTSNRTNYIAQISIKIRDLIEITCGKALVLFTSKSDMNAVFQIVSHMGLKQNIILQREGKTEECKHAFAEDIDSCLFATGAFWEGIDFRGKTLSHLIIVKLPFPIKNEPVFDAKIEGLSIKESRRVVNSTMLIHLAQGVGRAIRSETDIALISILDSRFPDYEKQIRATLPPFSYTYDMNRAISFSKRKILEENIKKHVKRKK